MSKTIKHNMSDKRLPIVVSDFYRNVYTQRQMPISILFIERLAADLIKWAQEDDDALVLRDFIHLKGIPEKTFYRWAKKHKVLANAKTEALSRIGARRERGVIKKLYDPKPIMYRQHRYDPTWKEDEVWRNNLKKEAHQNNEGDVTYKIVVDNYKDEEKEPTDNMPEE